MFLIPWWHLYHLCEEICKVNRQDHPTGRNATMLSWVCLSASGDSFFLGGWIYTTYVCLCFVGDAHALLAFCLFVCLFSPTIIFARADWTKNWGKHQKQLSKPWFWFCGWCDVGLRFRNDWRSCMAAFHLAPIIMLHLETSRSPTVSVITDVFIIIHFPPQSWLT